MQILGIDEVGRGSLAGPVVASAVVLDANIEGLADSKLLTKAKRKRLASDIKNSALGVGIGWAEPAEIDNLGLTQAIRLAMQRALTQIKVKYDLVIIDGNYNFLSGNPLAKCVVKADISEPSVSAASIIAKVARDEFMIKQAVRYPHWGFETNVGYGTKFHLAMLAKHGASEIHRESFHPIKRQG